MTTSNLGLSFLILTMNLSIYSKLEGVGLKTLFKKNCKKTAYSNQKHSKLNPNVLL